jgi:hypothetical protein
MKGRFHINYQCHKYYPLAACIWLNTTIGKSCKILLANSPKQPFVN